MQIIFFLLSSSSLFFSARCHRAFGVNGVFDRCRPKFLTCGPRCANFFGTPTTPPLVNCTAIGDVSRVYCTISFYHPHAVLQGADAHATRCKREGGFTVNSFKRFAPMLHKIGRRLRHIPFKTIIKICIYIYDSLPRYKILY